MGTGRTPRHMYIRYETTKNYFKVDSSGLLRHKLLRHTIWGEYCKTWRDVFNQFNLIRKNNENRDNSCMSVYVILKKGYQGVTPPPFFRGEVRLRYILYDTSYL